jgi:acetoin utilization deacetylase AcuC-like enzyme
MFPLVHHNDYTIMASGGGAGTHFPWNKYSLLMAQLRGLPQPPVEYEAPVIPRAALEAVHDPAYVEEVLAVRVPPEKARRIGFPITEALARRVQRTCGGTLAAARLALTHGYAANSAGGSHHAQHDCGAGYCIFNDLAVAARDLLDGGAVRHILIVDLDVHQGDGTAAMLAGETGVTTFSMHGERNYPVRKARSTLDIGLPDGCGDARYLDMLERHLPAMIAASAPDLILYQAGVDPHEDDRLGRLSLSDEGLVARDAMVASEARKRGIPLCSTLGGGYGADHAVLARRHAAGIQAMARSYYRQGPGDASGNARLKPRQGWSKISA